MIDLFDHQPESAASGEARGNDPTTIVTYIVRPEYVTVIDHLCDGRDGIGWSRDGLGPMRLYVTVGTDGHEDLAAELGSIADREMYPGDVMAHVRDCAGGVTMEDLEMAADWARVQLGNAWALNDAIQASDAEAAA